MSAGKKILDDYSPEEKKLSLNHKMKMVFPELAHLSKIPMSIKSHYLGTRAQVKSGEREMTWTGLTAADLETMTQKLRERGRLQYLKAKKEGRQPFSVAGTPEEVVAVEEDLKKTVPTAQEEKKLSLKKTSSKSVLRKKREAPVALTPAAPLKRKRVQLVAAPLPAEKTYSSEEEDDYEESESCSE